MVGIPNFKNKNHDATFGTQLLLKMAAILAANDGS